MNKIITNFLSLLGLDEEEVRLYSTLLSKGPLTVLELSRATDINRTTLYRILEKLKSKGIVEEIVDENRSLIKAAELHTLEFLVKDAELKVQQLKQSLPVIGEILSSGKTAHQPGTKVLFYRGKDGIKQQVWNTLRAHKECVGYSYRRLSELIGDYYIKWREEWVFRELIFRDIYSDEYLRSVKTHTINPHIPEGFFISKYIPEKTLNINHQVDIYNDVVSIYNWYEGEVFGVEIYNQKIAGMQRQLFEIVWQMAKPVE